MGKSKKKIINDVYFRSPAWVKNMFATYYGIIQRKRRYGKTFSEYLNLLNATQNKSKEEVNALQIRLLKDFLVFAFENTAFYNKRFNNCGFNPYSFNYPDELRSLPILTKEEVRKNARQISCGHLFKNTHLAKTSGTTGKPLSFPVTNECFQKGYAHQEYLFSLYQLNRTSKSAKCAGQQVVHINQRKPPYWVYDKLNRGLYMSSYHLSDDNLPHYINELERFKPEIIEGYPSSIYLLALANKKLNGKVRPRLVRTGSETLHDYQRAVIEEAFRCKAHNIYGSAENCLAAIECKEGIIHSQPLFGFLELVNDAGNQVMDNEVGNIVGTGLSNYAFPLIRYNMGDQAMVSEQYHCSCGGSGHLIKRILGRIEDYVVSLDGRRFGRLDHIFKGVKGLINGQIVQKRKGEIIIRIIKETGFTNASTKQLIKQARERLGNSIQITVEEVKELEKEKNGKTKLVISRITES